MHSDAYSPILPASYKDARYATLITFMCSYAYVMYMYACDNSFKYGGLSDKSCHIRPGLSGSVLYYGAVRHYLWRPG